METEVLLDHGGHLQLSSQGLPQDSVHGPQRAQISTARKVDHPSLQLKKARWISLRAQVSTQKEITG